MGTAFTAVIFLVLLVAAVAWIVGIIVAIVVKQVLPPTALAIWSLWMIGAFGFYTLGTRLWTQLDGVVIASRDIPPTRGPRYATQYTLRGPDGQESQYVAGASDASLARSIPVGTYLRKKRWHVDYERNGQRVDDFSLPFYLAILVVGLSGLCWSFTLWRREQPPYVKPSPGKSSYRHLGIARFSFAHNAVY